MRARWLAYGLAAFLGGCAAQPAMQVSMTREFDPAAVTGWPETSREAARRVIQSCRPLADQVMAQWVARDYAAIHPVLEPETRGRVSARQLGAVLDKFHEMLGGMEAATFDRHLLIVDVKQDDPAAPKWPGLKVHYAVTTQQPAPPGRTPYIVLYVHPDGACRAHMLAVSQRVGPPPAKPGSSA